jgi:hypothetical protein
MPTLVVMPEAHAADLDDVRVHQMHVLGDRPYLHGTYRGRLEHVSWFLHTPSVQRFKQVRIRNPRHKYWLGSGGQAYFAEGPILGGR